MHRVYVPDICKYYDNKTGGISRRQPPIPLWQVVTKLWFWIWQSMEVNKVIVQLTKGYRGMQCNKNDIYFTEFGADLTNVLPVLLKYCCKYCYSDSRKLWAVMKGGDLALWNLIQPTISLEMPVPSQGHYVFTVFRLLTDLSVYMLMSFDFPFVRLFGVR